MYLYRGRMIEIKTLKPSCSNSRHYSSQDMILDLHFVSLNALEGADDDYKKADSE